MRKEKQKRKQEQKKRQKAHGGGQRTIFIGLALAALYLCLALYTLRDTGVTWDETFYMAQSKARAYSLYAHATGSEDLFFCNLSASFMGTEWQTRCWEGRARSPSTISGVTWATAWFVNGQSLDVLSSIAAHRLAIVALTAAGLFVMFVFVSQAFNRRAALFSVLALIFIPVFFSHSKYLLFDEPSAIFWVITTFFFWKGMKDWRYGIFAGVSFGLALTTKEMVLFIPPVIILWLLVSYRDKVRKTVFSAVRNPASSFLRKECAACWSMLLLTPLVWMLSWPWMWRDTLQRISWWAGYYTEMMGEQAVPVPYFMGEVLSRSPAYLPFIMAAATVPLAILIFALLGGAKAVKDTAGLRNRTSFLMLLGAIVPVAVIGAIGVLYNGAQEFMPAFPFIAILAGIGADHFVTHAKDVKLLKRAGNREMLLTAVIIALFVLPGFIAIAKGHTDAYFSELFGGTAGIYSARIFEPEWSGEAYLDAARWLDANAAEGAIVYVPIANNIFNTYQQGDIGQIAGRMDVSSGSLSGFSFSQETLIRDDITIVGIQETRKDPTLLQRAGYVVLMSRLGLYESDVYLNELSRNCLQNNEPVYSVTLDGVPLASVYETPCS